MGMSPLTALGLASTAANALRQRKTGDELSKKLGEIGGPTAALGEDLIAQYKSGQLNPADEFNINKWEQQQTAQAKALYAKAGMGTSTAALNATRQIQAQAQAMRDQARQGLLTQGLNASRISQGPLMEAAKASAQKDNALSGATASALNSLMLLQALQSKGK